MKRILICDDHAAIRRGLKILLAGEIGDLEFVEAADTAESLHQFHRSMWDLVILDVNMPGRGGVEVLTEIRRYNRKVPILIYSMHPEEQVAVKSMRLGASGYISKSAAEADLIHAVKTVMSGKRYITPELAERLLSILENPEETALHDTLSPRELETMLLLAKGYNLKSIAEELSLSIQTVSTFKSRVLEKMGMRSVAELTQYSLEHKLL